MFDIIDARCNHEDQYTNTVRLTEEQVAHSYAIFKKQKHWQDITFETRTEYFLAGMRQRWRKNTAWR